MLSRWTVAFTACLFAAGAFPTAADAQVDFSHSVTFGDSLTHNDPLWLVYETTRPLYGDDPHQAVFEKGAGDDDRLYRLAVGGSESIHVLLQVAAYERLVARGKLPAATLFGFQAGANDVLNNDSLLKTGPPGTDPEADAVVDRLVRNIRLALYRLNRVAPEAQFIIWNVPDVTMTPDVLLDLDEQEAAHVRAHIERANAAIAELDDRPGVVVFDVSEFIRHSLAEPPVVFGRQLVLPPEYGTFDSLFADEIHPTGVTNLLLADAIIDRLNAEFGDDIPFHREWELAWRARIRPFAATGPRR